MATEHADEGRIHDLPPVDHGAFVNAIERVTDFFATLAVWLVVPTIIVWLAMMGRVRLGAAVEGRRDRSWRHGPTESRLVLVLRCRASDRIVWDS